MKKFITKIIFVFLILALLLTSIEFCKLSNGTYMIKILGKEVYHSINKSKKNKKVKALIVGDSVVNQMYSNQTYNDSIYSLACNQAISLAGNFFLINNFFNVNKSELPQKVLLILHPGSFAYNLDIFTFQYFLKPFYTDEYKPLMDDYLMKRIKDIPYYYTSQLPFMKTTNFAPEYELVSESSSEWLSPISILYLNKIDSLCTINDVELQLLAAPSRISTKYKTERMIAAQKTSLNNQFLLLNYIQSISYLPDSLFGDPVHFIPKYIPKDYYKLAD